MHFKDACALVSGVAVREPHGVRFTAKLAAGSSLSADAFKSFEIAYLMIGGLFYYQ